MKAAAFPSPIAANAMGIYHPDEKDRGMTLLDYFAAQALTGIIAVASGEYLEGNDAAKLAYDLAATMMAERGKR